MPSALTPKLKLEIIEPALVTYMVSEHDVEDYAKERKIAVYYSYDLQ